MKLSAAYLLEELKKNYPIYTPEHLSLQPELDARSSVPVLQFSIQTAYISQRIPL